jgi:Fe-S-cluster containining protein
LAEKDPFYKTDGLRFHCQRCSACCRLTPGYVFLSEKDIEDLLVGTNLPLVEFSRAYLRIVNIGNFARISLKEKENYDCIFWENDGCRVYDHRPLQCRSFPFWSALLGSLDFWLEHTSKCPGIGKGRAYNCREIDSWLERRLVERLIEIDPEACKNNEESVYSILQKGK